METECKIAEIENLVQRSTEEVRPMIYVWFVCNDRPPTVPILM